MAQTATEVSTHSARVVWKGTKQDVRAHEITLAGQTIECSNATHLGGDPAKPDPEEMFVGSLSSCHMLWFVSLARARRLRVTSYEDEAEGTMDGTRFTRVVLRPRVVFEGEVDRETIDELHHEAHERCFIANSVNCPVEVEA
jgi:organic hydroperoxide reductase OsmC/OhrA